MHYTKGGVCVNIRNVLTVSISYTLTGAMLWTLLHTGFTPPTAEVVPTPEVTADQTITQTRILSDKDLVAPEPTPGCFGIVSSPAEMAPILAEAADTLGITDPLCTVDTPIKSGTNIHYYLDDTIFAVSWKQTVNRCTYTFSEVKLAHASQFRRFFSEGKYNSGILHTTTEMSDSVNAVTAASGDYYSYRRIGIVVNDGEVYRAKGELLDTCYIDSSGDLLFTYAGEFDNKEALQSYVDEHDIRFSICFGPVMILDGKNVVPPRYNSGEINDSYPRAALCQLDELHYAVVCANMEAPDYQVPTVKNFAESLAEMGIPTAYALDGGQTAAIAFNDELINTVSYGSQREISDIIYFATAIDEKAEVSP